MQIIHFITLGGLSFLIALSLWSAFRPEQMTRRRKATTRGVIAFAILFVWIAYYRLGAAGIIPLL